MGFCFFVNNAINNGFLNNEGNGNFSLTINDINKKEPSIAAFLKNQYFTCKAKIINKDNNNSSLVEGVDVKQEENYVSNASFTISSVPKVDHLNLSLNLTFTINTAKFNAISEALSSVKDTSLKFKTILEIKK